MPVSVTRSRRRVGATATAITPDWELSRTFEGGTLGNAATGASGFTEAFSRTTFSDEQVYEGTKAAKIAMLADELNTMGGRVNFTSTCAKGDVLWAELYVYLPSAFSIASASGGPSQIKFLRVRCEQPGGINEGYVDVYLRKDAQGDGTFWSIKEGQDIPSVSGATTGFPRNSWARVNWYIKFDNVSQNDGGGGRMALWLNGALQENRTDITPLIAANAYAPFFLLFTYWNNGAPQDQHCYADSIRFAKNGRPSWALNLQEVP